eukprot:TRINITY_DN6299_c0_g1_i1.p1 TRINITY_DN6299_c0_g1~~TRINITY_DN6299_c0_g1_i1.p1  ORF type:complete len:277 (+),score=70.21 TRINITY_DN6299_c0_g1_i1:778-1608(+)
MTRANFSIMNHGSKYFIFLNLNGTLLYKSTKKLKTTREPDKSFSSRLQIYFRPDLHYLLSPILDDPLIKVGIYSSMKSTTINGILGALLESIGASNKRQQILVFDRKYCPPDIFSGDVKDTVKDLALVWNDSWAKKLGIAQNNTVLIEDDVKKASKCVENLLRMVPYQKEDVVNPYIERDSLLQYYWDYVKKMARDSPTDVREYLAKHGLPTEVTRWFDTSTEELLKEHSNTLKADKEEVEESKWNEVESLKNKEEKIQEMRKVLSSITLVREIQD